MFVPARLKDAGKDKLSRLKLVLHRLARGLPPSLKLRRTIRPLAKVLGPSGVGPVQFAMCGSFDFDVNNPGS